MRVFLAAVLAMIVIGIGAAFALSTAQKSAGAAYTTDGARIHPTWSWRQPIQKPTAKAQPATIVNASGGLNPAALGMDGDEPAGNACSKTNAFRWLFADFYKSTDESRCNI